MPRTKLELKVIQKLDDFLGDDFQEWGWWDGEDIEDYGFDSFEEFLEAIGNIVSRIKITLPE